MYTSKHLIILMHLIAYISHLLNHLDESMVSEIRNCIIIIVSPFKCSLMSLIGMSSIRFTLKFEKDHQ